MSLHCFLQYCSFDEQAVPCKTSIVIEIWLRGLHLARHSFHDQQKIRQLSILNYHSVAQIYFFHSCTSHSSFLAFCGILYFSGNNGKNRMVQNWFSSSCGKERTRTPPLPSFNSSWHFLLTKFILHCQRSKSIGGQCLQLVYLVFVSQSQEAKEVLRASFKENTSPGGL